MKERIKELAEQANLWRILNSYSWEFGNCDAEKDCGEELEKFAELIVRECGVALSPMLRDMVSRGQAFDLIKDHFGVEE